MSKKEMYSLLERMIESAEKKDKEEVLKLNESFEKIVPDVCHYPPTDLDLKYDNCRQSCVMALKMPGMYKKFISDAKDRFSKIPKP